MINIVDESDTYIHTDRDESFLGQSQLFNTSLTSNKLKQARKVLQTISEQDNETMRTVSTFECPNRNQIHSKEF